MKKYNVLGLLLLVYSQFSWAGLITLEVNNMFRNGLVNNFVSLVIDNEAPVTRLTDVVGEFDNAVQSGFVLIGDSKYDLSLTSVNTIGIRVAGTPRLNITGYMTDSIGNVESFLLHLEYITNTTLTSLSFLDVGATALSEINFDLGASMFVGGKFEISNVADVPEPAVIILFMFGLAVAVTARRLKGN